MNFFFNIISLQQYFIENYINFIIDILLKRNFIYSDILLENTYASILLIKLFA